MFGIGGGEVALIALLALFLFGPDKLPQMARTVGKFMREFNRYKDLMESTVRAEVYRADTDTTATTPAPEPAPEPTPSAGVYVSDEEDEEDEE